MLVRCPKCQTSYKVADDLLRGSSPAFRCSRCKHTFEVDLRPQAESGTEPHDPSEPSSAQAGSDQELSLPFDQTPAAAKEMDKDLAETSPADIENTAHGLETSDEWSLSGGTPRDEHQFDLPESRRRVGPVKVVDTPRDFPVADSFFPKIEIDDKADDPNNILTIANYREQRASILPFVTLFGLLVIAFAFVSLLSYAKPHVSEAFIREIPLIGGSLLRNDHLKNGILIQSLQSSYQTIQGNREVLLINGVARNQNPEVVREIQLSAVAYNAAGKELERQTIWVGNTISSKIIRGMTTEDIPHLQNLKPLKSFEIPPGDSIPFTIVFLKSAKTAREFSCEVLTANGVS
jgi:predicted Zn finger-like uncharacterized protein